MVTRWSCSTSNFYPLIGQNLTGSGNLFTVAEADRVFLSSCDVFHCLFPLDVQNEIRIQLLSRFLAVIHGWFVYGEMHRVSKSLEMRFRMASFSFFTSLDR